MNMQVVDDFLRFSAGRYAAGSRASSSYVAAIEKTMDALRRHQVFLAPGESIWDIKDITRLQELYDLVLREQSKGATGIFREEKATSYWKRNFCSAAIRNFIEYVRFVDSYEEVRAQSTTAGSFSSALEKIEQGLQGRDAKKITKVRVNQYLFRKMVLDNYNHRCCITGLSIPEVLRASHITPWAEDEVNRLDPQNGLCLSATFDAAFDRHLISLDEDLRLIFAPSLREYYSHDSFRQIFLPYEGKRIEQPVKFQPSPKFLQQHRAKLA